MRFVFALICSVLFVPVCAQLGKQKNLSRYYTFEELYDSATGIHVYDKLNPLMGGDSIRYNPKGYVCQGNWEDYYKSGAVLHIGFYIDGQLKTYKNYYENGQIEREFKTLDYTHYQMTLYYSDGKVRSDIIYYQGAEEVTKEYYPNGNPEFLEEYAKKCEYLMYRQFYYENGKMQSDMQLLDKKKKKYAIKEYRESGTIEQEGMMLYYVEIDNYMKEGEWKVYNESGKIIAVQTWVRGQMTEEKKM